MSLLTLIGGLRGIAAALSGAGLMFAALVSYDRLIDDPAVERAAREGFVTLAENDALRARLATETRRRAAVEAANAEFSRRALLSQAMAAAKAEKLEQEIETHEAALAAANRLCRLDAADLEFLRQPSGAGERGGQSQGKR